MTIHQFNKEDLKQLYIPPPYSHKGQNGKLLFIGGSHLFHAATIWPLTIASRIVDMVFYSSVPENNEIVLRAKEEFRNGMVIPRSDIESYIEEADAILLGPGMVRAEGKISNVKYPMSNIQEINKIEDEGEQTYYITKYLLEKYPDKKWIIDAGALQMLEPEWLLQLNNVIITPHGKEFELLKRKSQIANRKSTIQNEKLEDEVWAFAQEYNCIVVLKGQEDIVCSSSECVTVKGGNAGMTKGGTGDVLAGLIAALATKNDMFLAAKAGSYINKKAGESLFGKVGYYFNATDLVNEIPVVMRELLV